jgi:hypothetical protein
MKTTVIASLADGRLGNPSDVRIPLNPKTPLVTRNGQITCRIGSGSSAGGYEQVTIHGVRSWCCGSEDFGETLFG